MKFAKAAVGAVGVALALGAVSPAVAADPLGGGQQLLDTSVAGNKTVKNPLDEVDALAGTVDEASGKLEQADATTAVTKVGDIADSARPA
ncbi:hypothetical protein RB200_24265 [Streptomyces sp. PmtG]